MHYSASCHNALLHSLCIACISSKSISNAVIYCVCYLKSSLLLVIMPTVICNVPLLWRKITTWKHWLMKFVLLFIQNAYVSVEVTAVNLYRGGEGKRETHRLGVYLLICPEPEVPNHQARLFMFVLLSALTHIPVTLLNSKYNTIHFCSVLLYTFF